MANEIQAFENAQFGTIRALNMDGEPWFVAKDVCDALGLSNPTVAVNALDDDERAKFNLGRQGNTNIVSEAGFYKNRLFQWLRDRGYLMKQGSSKNMPTQRSMELGLFEVKERTVNNPDGSVRITKTTKVTGKGQQYFINQFMADN